ncbi:MAG: hypothetical protein VB118_04645 [Oscillospiraceae bacterium]|nr:hypothetical protein [Oscillospiraceae bacterium]
MKKAVSFLLAVFILIIPLVSCSSDSQAPQNSSISVEYITSPIACGKVASIKISGKPATKYSIKVYYRSGASSAAGLRDTVSDKEGFAYWSWNIGSRTTPGEHRIVIKGGGDTLETYFTTI